MVQFSTQYSVLTFVFDVQVRSSPHHSPLRSTVWIPQSQRKQQQLFTAALDPSRPRQVLRRMPKIKENKRNADVARRERERRRRKILVEQQQTQVRTEQSAKSDP